MNDDYYECAVYDADIAGGGNDPDSRNHWSQEHVPGQYGLPDTQHTSAACGWQRHYGEQKSYQQPFLTTKYAQPVQVATYQHDPGPNNQRVAAVAVTHDDSLKAVKDLPHAFHTCFTFRYFNPVQSECFDIAYRTDTNMVVSAPTGAGKTGVLELAMLRVLSKHLSHSNIAGGLQELRGHHKMIYLGPIKALVQERQQDWQQRFGGLGVRCVQLTGDVEEDGVEDKLLSADIICSTPEKFDQVTRRVNEKGNMGFFAEIALLMIDEVHLLGEVGRGSSLEAGCVCRLKAIAAFPEMAQAQISSLRFVAVSATIPNIADLAAWLHVPPDGVRQYGDELRPCKLTTHVKGYNPAKNDFLFERRLNEYVYGIVNGYCNGRPALVFCNSRKGTIDTASILVKEAEANARSGFLGSAAATGSVFVKTPAQLQRLQAAANSTKAKALAAALVAGVGFHNAAMEPRDRELVEQLFKASDLAVLCTTTTLAMGVNLPAHLVVIKGTTRYVGDQEAGGGDTAGYKEYSQTEMLQMVGRAGRPQFDTEGVAVIMTSKDNLSRYKRLLSGQAVESCLISNLPEHLNAEVVLGTIKDVPGAIQWIKSTFLFTRAQKNPQHYGLTIKPGMQETELDSLLKDTFIMKPASELMQYSLIATDEDSYTLRPTGAGKLMATYALKLNTMAAVASLGQRPNIPSLLRVICGAEEFKNTTLRRSERKVLNDINHSTDAEQLRYHVMATAGEGGTASKVKQRITTAQEKLFILLNTGLADKPAENLDYSLKLEQDRLLAVGQRIAKCMAKYYVLQNSFSAAGRSLLLARSLRVRLWDDSVATVRQLPSVGKLLGARLSAAGLGSLKALAACNDAHQVEVAAQKPYPWGSELLASLRSITPPPISMQLQVLETLPNRALRCQLALTRTDSTSLYDNTDTNSFLGNQQTVASAWGLQNTAAAAAGGALGGGQTGADAVLAGVAGSERKMYTSFTPCKLLCGSSTTDQLLLLRSVVLETFESPLQLQFKVDAPADTQQPISIAARLILDRVIGLDEKASLQVPCAGTHTPRSACLNGRRIGLSAANASGQEQTLDAGAVSTYHADGPAVTEQGDATVSKRRMGSSSCTQHAGAAGAVEDAAAAAKRHCGPERQHQHHQLIRSMHVSQQHMQQWNWQQQCRQQQQQRCSMGSPLLSSTGAPTLSRHTVQSTAVPGHELQQADTCADLSKVQLGTGASAGLESMGSAAVLHHVPDTAIAARYKKMLMGDRDREIGEDAAAAATESPSMIIISSSAYRQPGQQQQHDKGVMLGPETESASKCKPAAAAVDAARIQISPEHGQIVQQQDFGPGSAQELLQHNLRDTAGQQQKPRVQKQTQDKRHFGTSASCTMASLFHVLADDLSAEEGERQRMQQQQPLSAQQEQQLDRLKDPSDSNKPAGVAAAAPTASLTCALESSRAVPLHSSPQLRTTAACQAFVVDAATLPSASTVFAAAALQQHDKYRNFLFESRSLAATAAAAARSDSLRDGVSLATKSATTAEALHMQQSALLGPTLHAPAMSYKTRPANTSSTQSYLQQSYARQASTDHGMDLQQQQQLQKHHQRPTPQELLSSNAATKSVRGSNTAYDNSYSRPPGTAAVAATAATYSAQALSADLFTPSKQIVRSGSGVESHFSSMAATAAAVRNSTSRGHSSSSKWSAATCGAVATRSFGAVGGSSTASAQKHMPGWQHGAALLSGRTAEECVMSHAEFDADEDYLQHAGPNTHRQPNFQQFMFAAGGSTGAAGATASYQPSQNSLMFMRSSQPIAHRAAAQAKLTNSSRAQAKSQHPFNSINSRGSNLDNGRSSRPAHSQSLLQQQQQCGHRQQKQLSEAPAAPRVHNAAMISERQWGPFVDSQQQQLHARPFLSPAAAGSILGMKSEQERLRSNVKSATYSPPVVLHCGAAAFQREVDHPAKTVDAETLHNQEKQQVAVRRAAARAAWQPAANVPGVRRLMLGNRLAPMAGPSIAQPLQSLAAYTDTPMHSMQRDATWHQPAVPVAPQFEHAGNGGTMGANAAFAGPELPGIQLSQMDVDTEMELRKPVHVSGTYCMPPGSVAATAQHVDEGRHRGQLADGSTATGYGLGHTGTSRSAGQLRSATGQPDMLQRGATPGAVATDPAATLSPRQCHNVNACGDHAGDAPLLEETAAASDDLDFGTIFDFMK